MILTILSIILFCVFCFFINNLIEKINVGNRTGRTLIPYKNQIPVEQTAEVVMPILHNGNLEEIEDSEVDVEEESDSKVKEVKIQVLSDKYAISERYARNLLSIAPYGVVCDVFDKYDSLSYDRIERDEVFNKVEVELLSEKYSYTKESVRELLQESSYVRVDEKLKDARAEEIAERYSVDYEDVLDIFSDATYKEVVQSFDKVETEEAQKNAKQKCGRKRKIQKVKVEGYVAKKEYGKVSDSMFEYLEKNPTRDLFFDYVLSLAKRQKMFIKDVKTRDDINEYLKPLFIKTINEHISQIVALTSMQNIHLAVKELKDINKKYTRLINFEYLDEDNNNQIDSLFKVIDCAVKNSGGKSGGKSEGKFNEETRKQEVEYFTSLLNNNDLSESIEKFHNYVVKKYAEYVEI